MTYKETTDFLFSQLPMFQNLGAGAYKPGLETTLALSEAFNNPHKKLRACIHVAGTNGKGSTAHTLAAILQCSGYKVGLFTSPHLIDFRERIRVNGEMLPEKYVIDFIEKYKAFDFGAIRPSFFELTTIMALSYFVDNDVDIAVIEVGLGGRLDSTNIIHPDLCIVTNISLDHTALLGNTEELIAAEKAGIFKQDIPAVVGNAQGSVRKVFEDTAHKVNAPIYFAQDTPSFTDAILSNNKIIYKNTAWGDISGELTGDCQKENANTIFNAINLLKDKYTAITADAVANGFSSVTELTGLMGRWTTLQENPVKVICDTGHNIGGWKHLSQSLAKIAQEAAEYDNCLIMLIGFVNDKDINSIMSLMPTDARYIFTQPTVQRARAAEDTAQIALKHNLHGEIISEGVIAAYRYALKIAKPGDTIFVGGSTFIVADLLSNEGTESKV